MISIRERSADHVNSPGSCCEGLQFTKNFGHLGNNVLSVRSVIMKKKWVQILLSIQYTLLIFYIKVKKQSCVML